MDREAGEHFGPRAPHMIQRGHQHDRLEHAAGALDYPDLMADLDRRIASLEQQRGELAREAETPDLGPGNRSDDSSGSGNTRDDSSRGRW